MKIDLEENLPYVASIIGGVLSWIVTLLYLQEYLWLITMVVLFALLVLRFNPWAFIGSTLAGIAIELHTHGQYNQLYKVFFVIIAGTGLEIVARLSKRSSRSDSYGPPLGQNMTFAWIGFVFSFFVQYIISRAICVPETLIAKYSAQVPDGLSGTFFLVTLCQVDFVATRLSNVSLNDGLAFWNTLTLCFLYIIAQHPITWCVILAAFSEIRFKLYRIGLLIKKSFYGFLGMMAAVIIGYIPLLIGFAIIAGISNFLLFLTPDQEMLIVQFLMMSLNALILFILTLGVAWGVSWGSSHQ